MILLVVVKESINVMILQLLFHVLQKFASYWICVRVCFIINFLLNCTLLLSHIVSVNISCSSGGFP